MSVDVQKILEEFPVGDAVFAVVKDSEPWPAVVQSAVFDELKNSVQLQVTLFGSDKIISLNPKDCLSFEKHKYRYKLSFTKAEMEEGVQTREDIVMGKDECFPEVLLNFISLETELEEVTEAEVKKLGLDSIILAATEKYKIKPTRNTKEIINVNLVDDDEDNNQSSEIDNDDVIIMEEVTQGSSLPSRSHKLRPRSNPLVGRKTSKYCPYCGRYFLISHQLGQHVQKCAHKATKEAQTTSRRKQNLQQQQLEREIKPAEQVSDTDRRKQILQQQIERQKEILSELKENLLKNHRPEYPTQQKQKRFECRVCSKRFSHSHLLKKHEFNHYSKPMAPAQTTSQNGTETHTVETDTISRREKESPRNGSISSSSSSSSDIDIEGIDEFHPLRSVTRTMHTYLERERRAELRSLFENLADTAGFDRKRAKQYILKEAKSMIDMLQEEAVMLDKQAERLREMNIRLRSRCAQLRLSDNLN